MRAAFAAGGLVALWLGLRAVLPGLPGGVSSQPQFLSPLSPMAPTQLLPPGLTTRMPLRIN